MSAPVVSIAIARKKRESARASGEWGKGLLSLKIDADGCLKIVRKGPNGATLETYGLDEATTKKAVEKLYWDMCRARNAKIRGAMNLTPPVVPKWKLCGAPPASWVGETSITKVYFAGGIHLQEYPINKTPMAKAANGRCKRRRGHDGKCRNASREWPAPEVGKEGA